MAELYLDMSRKAQLDAGFGKAFGGMPQCHFSAPGRTEIGGNHTDHQPGRVLAAAVGLDMAALQAQYTVEDMCRSAWLFAKNSAAE